MTETKTEKAPTAVLNKGKCNFNSYRDEICVFQLSSQTVYLWYNPAPSSHMDAVDLYTCGLAGCQLMTGEAELVT